LGVADETEIDVARQMLEAGMFERMKEFSTTGERESDVFFRMSKSAQQSSGFSFVVERMPIKKEAVSSGAVPVASANERFLMG
jgi:hypothetical protein